MQSEILLRVEDLRVIFDTHAGQVQAVRGVSFDLAKGEMIAIVGESGSGKSVMTQSLVRLLPSPPARVSVKSISLSGIEIGHFKRRQLTRIKGKEIGYVFQDPMTSLNPTAKVGRQIMEALHKHTKMGLADARTRAIELLRLTGIPNPEKRFNQYPHELSGGMRQRAMIAIAIACHPKLLVADEPTTALDVTIQSQILEILKDLNREFGMSVILITHDLGIVANVASRVLVMYGGRVVESAPVDDLYVSPLHPYTQALLNSVPRLDSDDKAPLEHIIGTPPDMIAPPKGCAFAPRCKYCMRVCRELYPDETVPGPGRTLACWLAWPEGAAIREQADRQVAKNGQ